MSDFSPAQLDALEDALEDLESLGVPPEAGVVGGPEVAQRLDAYREILEASREALPLQDVQMGLLDGVIDEAYAAVAAPAAEPEPQTSWWKKFRGALLVPALAVAGSAALVLLLVRPGAMEAEEPALAAQSAEKPAEEQRAKPEAANAATPRSETRPAGRFDQGLADASVEKDKTRGRLRLEGAAEADRGGGVPLEEEAADEEVAEKNLGRSADAPAPPPAAAPSAPGKVLYDDVAPKKGKKSGGKGGSAKSEPEPEPVAPATPKPKPKPSTGSGSPAQGPAAKESDEQKKKPQKDDGKVEGWGSIASADKLRRAGNCKSAQKKYKPLSFKGDDRIRARAYAGLGLCELAAGNDGAAQGYFNKARKLDADIKSFIDHERPSAAAKPNAKEDPTVGL